jgi:hypothetical protein
MYKPSNISFGLPWRQPKNPLVNVAPEVLVPQEVALTTDANTAEAMARALEATGNYKILRRLVPRTAEPRSATDRIGLIIDLETTGLDTTRNEVLEIAAIKFGYADDRITSVIDTFVRAAGLEPAQLFRAEGFSYQLRISPPRPRTESMYSGSMFVGQELLSCQRIKRRIQGQAEKTDAFRVGC